MGLLMRLGLLGLWYGGVPCDSFGFLSSPTHGRGALTPWGNPWPFVFTGNVLCTRYAMLALVAIIRGCVWALEQPEKTTIMHMPPFAVLMREYLRPLMVKWFCPQMIGFNDVFHFKTYIYIVSFGYLTHSNSFSSLAS